MLVSTKAIVSRSISSLSKSYDKQKNSRSQPETIDCQVTGSMYQKAILDISVERNCKMKQNMVSPLFTKLFEWSSYIPRLTVL